jgi:hypothetical protein
VYGRFDKMDERITKVEDSVTGIHIKLESWKVWAISLYAALAASTFLVLAKGFKWF